MIYITDQLYKIDLEMRVLYIIKYVVEQVRLLSRSFANVLPPTLEYTLGIYPFPNMGIDRALAFLFQLTNN